MLGNVRELRRVNDLNERMRTQEAQSFGPTLGEFYAQFQGLPGLRGLWYPGAAMGETGSLPDYSYSARTLTYRGNPTLNIYNSLVPYVAYDGTGDYHDRASEAGLQISGTETYVAAALRGITVGAIFRTQGGNPTAGDGVLGKYLTTGNQRQYGLFFSAATTLQFAISLDGTLANTVAANIAASAVGAWTFAVGRYTPSTEVMVYNNGTPAVNTTAVPASCFATGTDAFWLARGITAGLEPQIDIAAAWLAAAVWPDTLIDYLYNRARPLFGV